jgi:hypothetical protein
MRELMAHSKWRTVSCTDDSVRSHTSQPAAYRWIAGQPAGARFQVQVNDSGCFDWQPYATVVSGGDGTTNEE